MYSSLSELHEAFDKRVLPKEYGGEMPMAEMIGNQYLIVTENREYFIRIYLCHLQPYGKKNCWRTEKH